MKQFALLVGVLAVILLGGASWVAASPPPYNHSEGLRQMWWTKPSGCLASTLANWSCGPPCAHNPEVGNGTKSRVTVLVNTTHQVQGFVAYNPLKDEIVVAFRGTRTSLNWVLDFDFGFVPYAACQNFTADRQQLRIARHLAIGPRAQRERRAVEKALGHQLPRKPAPSMMATSQQQCLVHAGFTIAYDDLLVQTRLAVTKYHRQHPHATVRVVGHSLGAAMATFSAVDLVLFLPVRMDGTSPVRSLYSFESPRVGNPTWVQFVTQLFAARKVTSVRVTHRRDPVPHLPLLEMGFLHIPHEVYYPRGVSPGLNVSGALLYKDCNDSAAGEDPTCSDSVVLQALVLQDHNWVMGVLFGCNDGVTP